MCDHVAVIHSGGADFPSVSVITVSFRDLDGLRATRASVLEQQYAGRVQHIVIDGGSGATVRAWLEQQTGDIVWVSEADDGIYDAMNKGIERAEGEVLWFMNSADVFHRSDSLRVALHGLTRPRERWGFGRSAWRAPVTGEVVGIHGPRRFHRRLHVLGFQVIPHQASFVGADLAAQVGGYRLDAPVAGDQVFLMQCARQVEPVTHPDILCDFDTQGVGTRQTRHEHYRGMRRARRRGDVTVSGAQVLDDAASVAVEGLDWLRRSLPRAIRGSVRLGRRPAGSG